MNLNDWFNKGMTPETYNESLDKLKEGASRVYNEFTLPNDEAFFQELADKKLRAIILAEPWCGHCMFNLPVFFRLAEKANISVRVLARDENLELMDQYLTNGKSRSIPIFIFIDEQGNEVAKWGPIAKFTKEFVDKHKETLPSKDAEDYNDKFKEVIKFMTKSFMNDSDYWNASYGEMKETLENAKG
ncbi:thioredoxin family protein [Bacillus sp. FJAT-50079]|uniref:thioredoxin family protein n=1 Tax=Bacillus sp. FJAT-50079 TaxID=2833577 RepID=UPI001BC99E2A|nr:thioredoxin family protein [Bacillus sp. FJAT-50079]MBS4210408.1 thioredoxin family protein [Bacillus sp. FJAT-50079]